MPLHKAHRIHRATRLRASVLGANDGIVSTACLLVGLAAAQAPKDDLLLAGIAGVLAGAMSMAAGEYVSVCSQADIEKADLDIEKKSLRKNYDLEVIELADIYQKRGLEPELANQVAKQLMEFDALGAHARDEIGISETTKARPIQAAIYSFALFTLGGLLPLAITWVLPLAEVIVFVSIASLISLTLLGAIAAKVGGAPVFKGAYRVALWGAIAMAVTAGVGRVIGVSI